MQKTFVKIISKKVLTTAFSSDAAADAFADKELNDKVKTITSNIESSIEFTGANENAIFFDVKVNNPDGYVFTLEIQDDEGKVLFAENYTNTNLIKNVKLPNEKLIAHYNFVIRSGNKESEQSFVVSVTNKVAEAA